MKILCETQVINRTTQANKTGRNVKATLAVGFHNGARLADGEREKTLEIIHFTPLNKNGTRYKVRNNIEKIFTKFIKDGKATISFLQPPENLMIKCDPLQLKGFLQTLKLGMDGKESINLRLNIASTTAIPQKSQPQLKMTVLKRGDYPTKGFPKTLKSLTVSGIQLCRISVEICSLKHLTVLNISSNQITKLPPDLGRLSLNELHVNDNMLGDCPTAWQWLQGKPLQQSLRELDMSANKLSHFPTALIKCDALVTLKLNNNNIRRIPFGVRRMRKLRFLHMSSNKLESLPSAFNHTPLELLDVWGNNFQPQIEHPSTFATAGGAGAGAEAGENNNNTLKLRGQLQKPTELWLQAARAVCQYKLPYNTRTLPWILVDILSESPKCACGKLCYAGSVLQRAAMSTFENVKSLIFSRDRLIYADIVLCGPTCAGRKQIVVS